MPSIEGFHPKSSTQRLCTKQREGGRGLITVRAIIQDDSRLFKTTKIQEHIRKMAPTGDMLSKCLRQQKPSEEKEERPS